MLEGMSCRKDEVGNWELLVEKGAIPETLLFPDDLSFPANQALRCLILGRWVADGERPKGAVALLLKKEGQNENVFSRTGLVLSWSPSLLWDKAEEWEATII